MTTLFHRIFLSIILMLLSSLASAATIYVKSDASGNDGTSWTNATDLQTALTQAVSGDEIWVAKGVYKPTTGTSRTATFQLKNGVALYGGFTGSETARADRDWDTNKTVLSGDIDNNDTSDTEGIITDVNNINGDNVYTVVTGSGTDNTAILDGFVITGGLANSSGSTSNPNSRGAGLFNNAGSPNLVNLVIIGNHAPGTGNGFGGGLFNYSNSSPTLTNVTFSNNTAISSGGGMYNYSSSPTLTDVTFSNNTATNYSGGGMYNKSSSPILTKVTFSNNTANYGGGIYNNSSSPTLTDVTFSSNTAHTYGGGLYNYSSNPTLTDITFSDNTASEGGGLYNESSDPNLTEVSFSNNTANDGAGIYNYSNSEPILSDVTFSNNTATNNGGGMNNEESSNPILSDVTFSSNTASNNGGGMNNSSSNPTLTEVSFSNNTASKGGGLYNQSSNPILTEVTFTDNTGNYGGGLFNHTSSPTLTNVSFSNNTTSNVGGGMNNYSNSNPLLNNVIFYNNSADWGGGIANYNTSNPTLINVTLSNNFAQQHGGGIDNQESNATLKNVIVWGNATNIGSPQINNYQGQLNISHSLIQDGCPSTTGVTCGNGNLNAEPLFVNQPNGDLRLSRYSPAIDVGDNNAATSLSTDRAGNARLFNNQVDIGAYEYDGTDLKPTGLAPIQAFFVEQRGNQNPFNGLIVDSRSIPFFADLDHDNDLDAIIGEYNGKINYYENTGTALSEKTGTANPFNGLQVDYDSSPAFIDLDNDSDLDFIVGSDRGTILYYKNTGTANSPTFEAQNGIDNPFDGISIKSGWSTPTFVDIDKDSDFDAFIGGKDGTVQYYENTGTLTSPTFVERLGTANALNLIDVGEQSKPTFVDIDHDKDFDVFIGEYDGQVNYYENIGSARQAEFIPQINPLVEVDIGKLSAPTFIDWDQDGDKDTLIGHADGTISYYENLGPMAGQRFTNQAQVFKGMSVGKGSTPSLADLDNDGDLDAVIGEEEGTLNYFENIGPNSNEPLFAEQTDSANPLDGIDIGTNSHPVLVDIDADGDIDAFIGEKNGTMKYYQNTGTATNPNFVEQTGTTNPLNEVNLGLNTYSRAAFVDLDLDNDFDVFIGNYASGTLDYYQNQGTPNAPNFVKQTEEHNPLNKVDVGQNSIPTFMDFDNDGDFDVFIGESDGIINYFENTGTVNAPKFIARTQSANPFANVNVGSDSAPYLVDSDHDGLVEAFIGENNGTIQHYEYTNITNALPRGGDYNFAPKVYLKCVACDQFYYTLDGSNPTLSSTPYSNPIAIPTETTTTLKYISVSGGIASTVTTETYLVDTQLPTVTLTAPEDQTELASLETITGTATDTTGGVGLDYIEVQISSNNLYLAENGSLISTPTWLTATDRENWQYDTSQVTFPAGNYTITARSFDKLENLSAEVSLTVGIAKSTTTLDLESNTATILNHGEFTLTGQLNRFPETTEDLSDLPITLTITAPGGNSLEISTVTSNTGQFRFDKDTENFPSLIQEGTYHFQAAFAGNDTTLSSESPSKMVLVGKSAGYAILIQGQIQTENGLAAHQKTSNRIYKTLKERGFSDDNLYYFNYSDSTDQILVKGTPTDIIVRGKPTKWTIAQAFADLQELMNSNPAPLYLIMIDHGGIDGSFHIYDASNALNDNVILPTDIDNWLGNLEAGLNANAKKKARLVILGANYSGNLIPTLSQGPTFTPGESPELVDAGRIIITSATAQEESYKGPLEPDGIRSSEFFMEEFFMHLNKGEHVKAAFELATKTTEAFTRQGGEANTTNRFYDDATQHPLLDDNGDETGSNNLSTGQEGQQAQQVFLGMGANYDINLASNPAEILSVSNTIYLNATESAATLIANVNNANRVNSAPVDIRPPSVMLSSSGTETSEQLEISDLPRVLMNCNSIQQSCSTSFDQFIQAGKYEAFYFVSDKETHGISPVKHSVIYKNKENNSVPSAFDLAEPVDDSEHKTTLMFKWNASTDSDGPVTYQFIVATDESFNEIVYQQEELEIAMTYMDNTVGLADQTTYYWKVEAVDPFGEKTTSSSVFSFHTNNINAPPSIGTLFVSSALDFTLVNNANITFPDDADINPEIYVAQGQYNMLLPPGKRRLHIEVDGYEAHDIDIDTTDGTAELNVEMIPIGGVPAQPGQLQFAADSISVDENAGTMTILVERLEGNDGAISVDYATNCPAPPQSPPEGGKLGEGTCDSDYTSISGTLEWSDKEERAKAISLSILDDQDYEGDETLTLILSNPTGEATLGTPSQITVTMLDDEAAPEPVPGTLQFSSSTYSAEESDGALNITVSRTKGFDGLVSVQYLVNGTATLNQDYTGGSGSLTWSDGDNSDKSLNLKIIDDDEVEDTETLTLTLLNPTGEASLGNRDTATLSITDNDTATIAGTLQFDTATQTVTEGEKVTLTVTRTGGSDGEVSVQYMTTGESTAISSDYTGGSGELTWADGEEAAQSFTIKVIDDEEVEETESIQITLVNPTGEATLVSPAQATVNITDNDVNAEPVTTEEPEPTTQPVAPTVTPPVTPVPMPTPGTPKAEIEGTKPELPLEVDKPEVPSEGTKPELPLEVDKPEVPSEGNKPEEPSEGNKPEEPLEGSPEAKTKDSKTSEAESNALALDIVQFATTLYTATEGENVTLTVERTGPSQSEISVQTIVTGASTAMFGDDYTGGNDTLTWLEGDKQPKTFTVTLVDDEQVESSETVGLMLINPTGPATLGPLSQATVIINDNDEDETEVEPLDSTPEETSSTGTLQFMTPFYTINEGIGIVTAFTVTRTDGSDGEVSVQYQTLDDGSALPDFDYAGGTGAIHWDEGDNTPKSIALMILDDQEIEDLETIRFILFEPTGGATLGSVSHATLFIADNDTEDTQPIDDENDPDTSDDSQSENGEPEILTGKPQAELLNTVQFTIDSYTVQEDDGTVTLDVIPTTSSDAEFSVQYTVIAEGTTATDDDYASTNDILTWAPNENAPQSITLSITEDEQVEESETIRLMLFNANGIALGDITETTVTILDNDQSDNTVQFTTDSYTVQEDDGTVTLDVIPTTSSDAEFSVQYTVIAEGTTATDDDYASTNDILTWAPNENAPQSITLSITEDEQVEESETIRLMLFNANGIALGDITETTVTILDNDQSDDTGNTSILLLPNLGPGTAVAPDGTVITADMLKETANLAIVFWGGASFNGLDYQTSLMLSPDPTQMVSIIGEIEVDTTHEGQTAEILIVAALFDERDNVLYLMRNSQGQLKIWDGNLDNLVAAQEQITLEPTQPVEIYHGINPQMALYIFFGYRLDNGLIFYNREQPIALE
jgi:hypothetical protein